MQIWNYIYIFAFQARIVEADEKSIIVRSVSQPGPAHVWLLREDINTMDKMLRAVVFVHGEKRSLGTRQILNEEDEIQPNGRVFKKVSFLQSKRCITFQWIV